MEQILRPQDKIEKAPLSRLFPAEGTNLYRILNDPAYKSAFHARLQTYNPFVVAFYRLGLLPLFGASRTVMLLTTRGRKTGKLRQTPVGYFRIDGLIYLFSAWGRASNWYRNLQENPQSLSIQIGLRKWPVRAELLENPAEIQATLQRFISGSPAAAHELFGWDPQHDTFEHADFSPVIKDVLIVWFVER
ncbi:MAG TPA: nitroreductase family deazaflavin-dependent oxidoreductase [Anaerolineales bacterium]